MVCQSLGVDRLNCPRVVECVAWSWLEKHQSNCFPFIRESSLQQSDLQFQDVIDVFLKLLIFYAQAMFSLWHLVWFLGFLLVQCTHGCGSKHTGFKKKTAINLRTARHPLFLNFNAVCKLSLVVPSKRNSCFCFGHWEATVCMVCNIDTGGRRFQCMLKLVGQWMFLFFFLTQYQNVSKPLSLWWIPKICKRMFIHVHPFKDDTIGHLPDDMLPRSRNWSGPGVKSPRHRDVWKMARLGAACHGKIHRGPTLWKRWRCTAFSYVYFVRLPEIITAAWNLRGWTLPGIALSKHHMLQHFATKLRGAPFSSKLGAVVVLFFA